MRKLIAATLIALSLAACTICIGCAGTPGPDAPAARQQAAVAVLGPAAIEALVK